VEVGGGRLGSKHSIELLNQIIGQIMAEAPDVATGGAAQVETRSRAVRLGLVDGTESPIGIVAECNRRVQLHELEIGQHAKLLYVCRKQKPGGLAPAGQRSRLLRPYHRS